ncbi:tetratricopeptide repeat protein [Alteromonas ponticola]|uniref:Tetratricopeptide repeat protein n=1 Tax=Alteromonas aquimaris TaxID=2998417 RepID=A0ABT3P4J4_9ALTE|nr:tetratricopeptide repeat protein [Alteromonas aquimaris]MCW8107683.1 tetratricopeptide repeat protein [Alteromonas aquimaris]
MTYLNEKQIVGQLLNAYNTGQVASVVNYVSVNRQLLKLNPVIIHIFAQSLRRQGDNAQAEKVLNQGLKKFKNNPDLLNSLGNLYLSMAKPTAAINVFKKALQAGSPSPDIMFNLSRAYNQASRFEEAIRQCKHLLTVKPDYSSAKIVLAESYVQLGDRTTAKRLLQDITMVEPGNIKALNNLANLFREEGKYSQAISYFRTAMTHQPDNALILRNLAACYVLNVEKEAALEMYRKAIGLAPLDWQLHEELALFLWAENADKPFQYIESQIAKTDTPIDFKLSYIQLLSNADEFRRALELCNEIEKVTSSLPAAFLVAKARIHRELHNFSDALHYSKLALATKGAHTIGAMSEHGYALLSVGEAKAALTYFQTLHRLEPANQGWWTMISTCWKMLENRNDYLWLCDYTNLIHVKELFQDPIENVQFNNQLSTVLKDLHHNSNPPIGQSLQNGTQTYEDLLESELPILQQLKVRLIEEAKNFIRQSTKDKKHPFLGRLPNNISVKGSWSVHLHTAGFHKSHFHPQGWLSGVYYVDLPDEIEEAGQGWIVFGRAEVAGQHFEADVAVKPQVGSVVFFPAYMWHGTNPFSSQKGRLTVAFDIVPD